MGRCDATRVAGATRWLAHSISSCCYSRGTGCSLCQAVLTVRRNLRSRCSQAEAIVARLRSSEDPAWREAGEYEHAVDVVAGLAWQFFKKDWSDVS